MVARWYQTLKGLVHVHSPFTKKQSGYKCVSSSYLIRLFSARGRIVVTTIVIRSSCSQVPVIMMILSKVLRRQWSSLTRHRSHAAPVAQKQSGPNSRILSRKIFCTNSLELNEENSGPSAVNGDVSGRGGMCLQRLESPIKKTSSSFLGSTQELCKSNPDSTCVGSWSHYTFHASFPLISYTSLNYNGDKEERPAF